MRQVESRPVKARTRALGISVATALAVALVAPPSFADATCISAYEQAQTLRKDGKPVAARAQAAVCARDTCPALLTKDCTKWLAELDAIIPSVVLDPRTPNGQLRADARVKIDGIAVTDKIDGKPMSIEPGAHTFVFEAEGGPPVEKKLVIKEGEKAVKVTTALAAVPAPRTPHDDDRPIPMGVWIFGGVSVVALATSAVFAIDGLSKKSDLDECKPRCAADDVDAMSTRFTLADVALGAGVMAGAAALYLYFTRPTAEAVPPPSARLRAVPYASPLPGGGGVGVTARF